MKKLILLSCVMLFCAVTKAEKKDDDQKKEAKYRMFSVEGSYVYNSFINKNGANAKFYFWVNKSYNFGTEFYFYLPTQASTSPDFQLDLNFRKILVNFHPVTFDVLLGPGFRNFENSTSGNREWVFDGINIGFGIAYRVKDVSLFVMPKINHLDPSLQLTTGIKYHFDINRLNKWKNRYNLNKS